MAAVQRLRANRLILGAAVLGVVLIGISAVLPAAPRLVWNASASAPRGLYLTSRVDVPRRGDLVLVTLPDEARRFAAMRGYLPGNVPILKRIAATNGARICTEDGALTVLDRTVSRLASDRAGRPLPHWQGCRALASSEIFLLMADIPDSFDSRYFGPVSTTQVIGKARPLWTE